MIYSIAAVSFNEKPGVFSHKYIEPWIDCLWKGYADDRKLVILQIIFRLITFLDMLQHGAQSNAQQYPHHLLPE